MLSFCSAVIGLLRVSYSVLRGFFCIAACSLLRLLLPIGVCILRLFTYFLLCMSSFVCIFLKVSLAKLADHAWSLDYYKNMIAEITDMKGSAAENFITQCTI